MTQRNKFPGPCYRCGEIVEKGKGHFQRYEGRWLLQHAECAIKYRGTDVGHEGKQKAPRPPSGNGGMA